MSSRTRSHFAPSHSAPSSSSMKDHSERRSSAKSRRARELTCETCGKVYKHPVCLQKHRWEHNPLWRDTAQLLLSKHQQVQVMEAAAILIHGAALPSDRALWPSYMSGGKLPSPKLAGDGTLRELTPQLHATRAISPVPTLSSSSVAAREDDDDDPPSDTEELEELEEAEEEIMQEEEEEQAEGEEDETDESDVPVPHVPSTPIMGTRARSQSLAAPVQSHMPNLYGSYGVGYGWGVIGENATNSKSPKFDAHTSPIMSPRSPMAIPADATHPSMIPHGPAHHHRHGHHHSISSFGSFTSSSSSFIPFGSAASTSSYIPSSSVRSGDWHNDKNDEEEEDNNGLDGMDMEDDGMSAASSFAYGSRASSLYKRLAAVTGNTPSNTGMYGKSIGTPTKSSSLERRREEYMYEMDMD